MKILVIGGKGCSYCLKAKEALDNLNLEYTYQDIKEFPEAKSKILDLGLDRIPQIFIDGEHIGGSTELDDYLFEYNLLNLKET